MVDIRMRTVQKTIQLTMELYYSQCTVHDVYRGVFASVQ